MGYELIIKLIKDASIPSFFNIVLFYFNFCNFTTIDCLSLTLIISGVFSLIIKPLSDLQIFVNLVIRRYQNIYLDITLFGKKHNINYYNMEKDKQEQVDKIDQNLHSFTFITIYS